MPITLVLGGARSGKSCRAEALAEALGLPVIYVATAPRIKGDSEWSERIEHHQARRSSEWETIEEELALVEVMREKAAAGTTLFVDCLTLWLSNLMFHGRDIDQEVGKLCALLPDLPGHVILVSNEVGMGLVPESPEGRAFRDAQGRLNQAVAAVVESVEFVAAGLPIRLKGDGG